jgi:hypothetical protein
MMNALANSTWRMGLPHYPVIGEPDRGLLHVSAGNPCESEYFTYEL